MSVLVFKILKPSSTFHGIDYNERKKSKDKASLLYFNNFMYLQEGAKTIGRKEAKDFMDWWCSDNKRIRNKQFHAILSCKGKAIELNRLKDYGLEIMNQLGYENNPILIYGHNDTKHNHIHIITPRIDANGKKILHHFEKKRANQILNSIIGIDYSKEVKNDIEQVLSYQASTIAQYKMLFELRGYDVKQNEHNFDLYKYGSKQSSLTVQEINNCINLSNNFNTKKIAALLYKYKKQYSAKLSKEENSKYITKKKTLQSDLTKFFQQRFGLQFIFFTGKNHEEPYGYLIIDHQQKVVYKGSEVMKLQTLLSNEPPSANEQIAQEIAQSNNTDNTPSKEQVQPSNYHQHIPGIPFEKLIDAIEHDVERDVHKEEHAKKRKKGRFI